MLEPGGKQKVYLTSDDLSKVYPEAADAEVMALDVVEGENSYIVVDGEQLSIGYDEDKDAVFIMVMNESDDTLAKARKMMQMFVDDELFDTRDIEKENGAVPDDEYPMSVNIAGKGSQGAVSYYPSYEQMANAEVDIWSGSGYSLSQFFVNVPRGGDNPEEALEVAVAMAEKIAPGLLHDVSEVEDEMAKDGHYDPETGEGDAIFNETYFYVDATMSGASRPYYIYAENLGVRDHDGELA